MLDDAPPRISERAKVEAWRLYVLIDAGYPVAIADRLASRLDVDLHRAVELVAAGCAPGLAAEILL